MSGELTVAFSPHECRSEQQARHLAVDLSTRHWGVLAWILAVDPKTNRYGEPMELVRYGAVPAHRAEVYSMVDPSNAENSGSTPAAYRRDEGNPMTGSTLLDRAAKFFDGAQRYIENPRYKLSVMEDGETIWVEFSEGYDYAWRATVEACLVVEGIKYDTADSELDED